MPCVRAAYTMHEQRQSFLVVRADIACWRQSYRTRRRFAHSMPVRLTDRPPIRSYRAVQAITLMKCTPPGERTLRASTSLGRSGNMPILTLQASLLCQYVRSVKVASNGFSAASHFDSASCWRCPQLDARRRSGCRQRCHGPHESPASCARISSRSLGGLCNLRSGVTTKPKPILWA